MSEMSAPNERLERLFENFDLPRDPAWIREVNRAFTELLGFEPKFTHAENGSITIEFEDGSKIELLEAVH